MKRTLQRGFTLIELLVVIAIIGILAAVVLASLNDARSNGTNASVQQTTNNIRAQAEIFYNAQTPPSYLNVCADPDVNTLQAAVNTASNQIASVVDDGTLQTATTHNCFSTAAGYAASSPLIQTGAAQTYYCVDSTGFAGVRTLPLAASAITCPAT